MLNDHYRTENLIAVLYFSGSTIQHEVVGMRPIQTIVALNSLVPRPPKKGRRPGTHCRGTCVHAYISPDSRKSAHLSKISVDLLRKLVVYCRVTA